MFTPILMKKSRESLRLGCTTLTGRQNGVRQIIGYRIALYIYYNRISPVTSIDWWVFISPK